jgi:hypothetical protein
MAESAPNCFGADPLNLMRVMPPKGARVRCRTVDVSQCARLRMAFYFMNVIPNEMRGPPKSTLTTLIHDSAQRHD